MGRSKAANTRMVYALDKALACGLPTAPMSELRSLGERIWRENSPWKARCPRIIAGKGMRHCGTWISYCEGRHKIVMARHERNRIILIHEMAHALTNWLHGVGFQNKYAELLARYE